MSESKSILVGVDFSDCSRAALAQALRLGKARGCQVHAAHVVDTLVVVALQEVLPPEARAIHDQSINEARRAWEQFAAAVPGGGGATFHVEMNNRIAGVLGLVEKTHAGLLVLGCSGDPETGIGTMTTECIGRSPADVLLVRENHSGPFKRVVACVDFSQTSRGALDAAAQIAAADGAQLSVVHVFEAPWTRLYYRLPALDAADAFEGDYRRALEARLREFVAESGAKVAAASPTCELFDGGGHRSGIAEYARSRKADLVVLGTHGRSNLRDTLLGSTAVKALQKTTCSVLAVKPRAVAARV
ncbi:MAG: hypothetical protein AMXMBFR58_02310 [Phycisphaerae bacterium]|nr:hypothetical protein [Phycisphaerales bacterium]